jgi:hypothetical protein
MGIEMKPSRMRRLVTRLPELGRMRLGAEKSGNRPGRPLDTFRFTAPDRAVLDQVAALYGGEVVKWGADQWQVIVTEQRIPVMIPPPQVDFDGAMLWKPVDVTYEHWVASGWDRRCDGNSCTTWTPEGDEMVQTIVPCQCNIADEAGFEPCKPVTRLNVVVQDVYPAGVFMLSSTGWNAAAELPGLGNFLSGATTHGIGVPATLRIESVTKRGMAFKNAKNKSGTVHFKKPVLEVMASFNAAGQLSTVSTRHSTEHIIESVAAPTPALTDQKEDWDERRRVIIDQLGKCQSAEDVGKVESWIDSHTEDEALATSLRKLTTARRVVLEQE